MSLSPVIHADLQYDGPPSLKSLWIEVPPYCHLLCPYCFANSGPRTKKSSNWLSWRDYEEKILQPFAEIGGQWLGIPGAGEPFLNQNRELTLKIIDCAGKLGLKEVVVFTTGDKIDEELARTLYSKPFVRLMVKWNSMLADVQNRLVGDQSGEYFSRRQAAWDRLLDIFKESEDRNRLGMVTSVLADNWRELPEILKYARGKGVVFDCDTLLPRGRGLHCLQRPLPDQVRQAVAQMAQVDRELGQPWHPAGAYVGCSCNRYLHHLYLDHSGNVSPCVGSVNISLGNIKERSLATIWKSRVRQALVHRRVSGACAACARFANGDCTSCLGRDLSTGFPKNKISDLLRTGWFSTIPCEMFLPEFSVALHAAGLIIRGILKDSYVVNNFLQDGLENLWDIGFTPEGRIDQSPHDVAQQFLHFSELPEPSFRRSDHHMSQWVRANCLTKLLADRSPITLVGNPPDSKGYKRIVVSSEGFPIELDCQPEDWIKTNSDINSVLPSVVKSWIGSHLLTVDPHSLTVAVSHTLNRLLTSHSKEPQQESWDYSNKLDSTWFLQRVPRVSLITSAPESYVSKSETVRGGQEELDCSRKVVDRFDLVNRESGYRIDLEGCWTHKFVHLTDAPNPWAECFDNASGNLTQPDNCNTGYNSQASVALPTLLVPLTSLVLEHRAPEPQPIWVLWLFYDPVNNSYFRRLVDCRSAQRHIEDRLPLSLIYLWPEKSDAVDKLLNTKVRWFDANILNLSDVLRNPIVDYELINVEDSGPSEGLANHRFAVLDLLQGLKPRSKRLLDAARSSGFDEYELRFLESERFDRPSLNHVDVYKKMARTFQLMDESLFLRESLARQSSTINALYQKVPRALQSWIRHALSPDVGDLSSDHKRRALNYFIFLGALKELGANHYYVGQTLTHNLIPEVAPQSIPNDWNMTPCGFIVASQEALTDGFIADLRLVYSTVMAPIIEQYAKWSSDYEPERVDVQRSLPCLQRLPTHYIRKLKTWALTPDISRIEENERMQLAQEFREEDHRVDLQWVRKLPKADLHVHLGPAIPLHILYDLSMMSLVRLYSGNDLSESEYQKRKKAVADICEIISKSVRSVSNSSPGPIRQKEYFKDTIIKQARETLHNDSIQVVNSIVRVLAERHKIKTEECACIINVLLGYLVRPKWVDWASPLRERVERIQDFLAYVKSLQSPAEHAVMTRARKLVAGAYLAQSSTVTDMLDCRYKKRMDSILSGMSNSLQKVGLDTNPLGGVRWEEEWGDPLSDVLSMPWTMSDDAKGLDYYIGATDLTGSSVLQSFETLFLALAETAIHASKTDSVRYLEIKLSPRGLIGNEAGMGKLVLSWALLSLSYVTDRPVQRMLEENSMFWLEDTKKGVWPYILANIIVAGKRHDSRDALRLTIQHAVDSRDKYLSVYERVSKPTGEKESERHNTVGAIIEREGVNLVVPRVVGVDLVGKERGVRHSELSASMEEAFEKCLLLTIHAGEDEDEKSIWEALFSLHAQRIGHGVRMTENSSLSRLFSDRRIPIELCPTSNHFTNGFFYSGMVPYSYDRYHKANMTLTISTDDPWVSHRMEKPATGKPPQEPYPLSSEFLALPLLYPNEKDVIRVKSAVGDHRDVIPKPGYFTRDELLRLIFNGFDNSFVPARDRDALIALADLETFLVICRHDLKYSVYEAKEMPA